MNKPEVFVRRGNLMLVSRAPSFFCQPIYFLFTSPALLGILATVKNVCGILNRMFDDWELLLLLDGNPTKVKTQS